MKWAGAGIASIVLFASGCSFHNVIYNGQQLYAEAEEHRRAGRDSMAVARYVDVIRKTGQAFRSRPESDWAAEALFLLGRAHLRLADLSAAGGALREAASRANDPKLRGEILVYLAVVRADLGDRKGALEQVDVSLEGPLSDASLAEARLLRGRLMLEAASAERGWWELDRASEAEPSVRSEAGLELLRWAIATDDSDRSRLAIDGLLAYPGAGMRLDSILSLVELAAKRWGDGRTADLLSGADSSTWDRKARGTIVLERARRLKAAGDSAAAASQAWQVAGGLGVSGADARLLLSAWQMAGSRDLVEIRKARAILLPAGGDERVGEMLEAMDLLENYISLGLDEPLGWFAAGEVARERLGADYLARGLFLAYADGAREDPWAPKALLAALEASPDEGDRAWLRGRLERYADSPYVLAAYGGSAAGFQALEEELEVRLRELTRQ